MFALLGVYSAIGLFVLLLQGLYDEELYTSGVRPGIGHSTIGRPLLLLDVIYKSRIGRY
jgi:hypothetical protein